MQRQHGDLQKQLLQPLPNANVLFGQALLGLEKGLLFDLRIGLVTFTERIALRAKRGQVAHVLSR